MFTTLDTFILHNFSHLLSQFLGVWIICDVIVDLESLEVNKMLLLGKENSWMYNNNVNHVWM